jgi:hypothetical protein
LPSHWEAKLAIQAATSIGYDTQALSLMAVAVALIGVNVAMMHGLGPGQQLDGSARRDYGRRLIHRLYLYFCAAPKYAAERCKVRPGQRSGRRVVETPAVRSFYANLVPNND